MTPTVESLSSTMPRPPPTVCVVDESDDRLDQRALPNSSRPQIGVMFGRQAATTAEIGNGHSLKHRVIDVASGAMQPKYPPDAMSTYLNGFHMYADEMGGQVEASHFCIRLRGCGRVLRAVSDRRQVGHNPSRNVRAVDL
jgi:hypothetical protein